MTRTYFTTLRCGGCVGKVKPGLDAEPGLATWHVDLESPAKTLTVDGTVTPERVKAIVAAAGFEASEVPIAVEPATSYFPLALIVAYLLGITALVEYATGSFDVMRAMRHFMAGFFLAFSFFKLLDVRGFADSYAMYDLLARRSRLYALAYPFLELGLGMAYLLNVMPLLVNGITLAVMLLGTAGVAESLRSRRRVRCACLGGVFNLPMSKITLIEDLVMAVMAALMLAMG